MNEKLSAMHPYFLLIFTDKEAAESEAEAKSIFLFSTLEAKTLVSGHNVSLRWSLPVASNVICLSV